LFSYTSFPYSDAPYFPIANTIANSNNNTNNNTNNSNNNNYYYNTNDNSNVIQFDSKVDINSIQFDKFSNKVNNNYNIDVELNNIININDGDDDDMMSPHIYLPINHPPPNL
jgi:hypothetical protein